GDIYFKATAPALAHELALTEALARWRPDCIPEVLALDLERAWMLMPDVGASLRSLIRVDRDLGHWHRVLPLYAELQIEVAGHLGELLALGVPDRRLSLLPGQYESLLADTEAVRIGLAGGLTPEEYRRLRELAPRFAALCGELADYNIPESLDHNDLHDGNIFVRDGRYVFADWGDACAAHPFFSLLVTLVSVVNALGLEEHAPEMAVLRDVYLEPWTRFESRENLLAAFALAQQAAMVCRALTWQMAVVRTEEGQREEHAGRVPAWLQEFLKAESAED
ncbi:MAG TPA: phosphotransferase, partial [Ardenticatenaceae bacterium]|nr:phosphotransferase [Ardenticatenaceae bacterium]